MLSKVKFSLLKRSDILIYLVCFTLFWVAPYLVHKAFPVTANYPAYIFGIICSSVGAFVAHVYHHRKFERTRARWEFEKSEREMASLVRFRDTIATIHKTHTDAMKEVCLNGDRQNRPQ